LERFVTTTTVLDRAAAAAPADRDSQEQAGCTPAACRIGLLGLGNIGSAFARLSRDAAAPLAARGLAPIVTAALVRNVSRPRPAAGLVAAITDSHDRFFSEPVDIVVEALGGVEPAFTLVRRALDRGIPVVTANKSLVAAHGDDLARLARRRGTALRYEAACIAGVPFVGTFERRGLGAQASGVTAILNGTSNYILTTLSDPSRGGTFEAALAEAQHLGYAEPNPTMDVSGTDAAEKLTILVRLFGRLLVDPGAIPLDGLGTVDADDIAAARAFDGAIRPVSRASWQGRAIRAHVGPVFLGGTHPLARVSGVTNGIVIDADRGALCYIGPGAGPDVTAATLLDDVSEIVTERRVLTPPPGTVHRADSVARPDSGWFVRLTGGASHADVADLLGSYGIWCTRIARRGDRVYALTCAASQARLTSALEALRAATGVATAAFPAIPEFENAEAHR
jgi:homoserine dehydrogenase